jgi:hypothetical protein
MYVERKHTIRPPTQHHRDHKLHRFKISKQNRQNLHHLTTAFFPAQPPTLVRFLINEENTKAI